MRYNAFVNSIGTVNLTIIDNTDTGSASGLPAYELDTQATFTGAACMRIRNNNTD